MDAATNVTTMHGHMTEAQGGSMRHFRASSTKLHRTRLRKLLGSGFGCSPLSSGGF